MVRRTKAEAEQTRSLILDTAEKVFSEKGVSRTSLADIAQAAGLTRGAIYWHFANKVDLFEAMLERIELPIESLQADIAEQADPLTALRDFWVRAFHEVVDDEQVRCVLSIMFHKCEYVDEMSVLLHRRDHTCCSLVEVMTQAFEKARRQGLLAAGVEPGLAALALRNFVLGTVSDWLFAPQHYDLKSLAEPLLELLLRGLRAQPR
ncbi:MAG TPA: TetR family transcriptional regulator [Candidatus Competibacteraceae bacterium]|nr:TetR family transcriptional regulator [Candidatus Competibacteraceae bacterium]